MTGRVGIRASAGDGARVGMAIALLATAAGFWPGGWWLFAGIPAGALAGWWAAPRVAVGEPVRARVVGTAAAIATVVGAAAVSGIVIGSPSIREGGLAGILRAWIAATVAGLVVIGWLAWLVLVPVSAAGIAIVRARAARPEPAIAPGRRGTWIGGVVVGLASGFLALTLPVAGYAIALLFLVGALLGRETRSAGGGLLLGFGSGWVALILNGTLRCDPASCIPPDITPWLAVGLAVLALGCVTSIAAAARR